MESIIKKDISLFCMYSNINMKLLNVFRKELRDLGYKCRILQSRDLVKVFGKGKMSGSMLVIYSLEDNFFSNYTKLMLLLKKYKSVVTLCYYSEGRVFTTESIHSLVHNIRNYNKEVVIGQYVQNSILKVLNMMLLNKRVILSIINREKE